MVESKVFTGGGLNQDVDESLLKSNEWDYALNIRNTDRLEFSDGVISNLKGNTLVTYSLPSGTNKCIGSYANESTSKFYSFIYNSLGNHLITEYDNATGVISLVLQASYLNFQPFEYINGVGMIDAKLLYWTDGFNPQRSIDITKAKTGTYYTDGNSISLAKAPPQDIINATYANDPSTVTSNRLKNQLFQFRYLYIYEDGSRSAWSTCSEVPLPSLEITSTVNTSAYRNNHIVLQFNAGTKFVKSIEVAAQVKGVAVNNTQDWFSILTIDRSEVLTNEEYQYNSTTNKATFSFYNDGLYQSIDIQEIDLPYDFIPLKSKCLDIVNGNVLVLANNTEGYDNINVDIDIAVTYTEEVLSGRLTKVSDFADTATNIYSVVFIGTPIAGDVVGWTAQVEESYGPENYIGSYTVSDAVTGSLTAFADELGVSIQSAIPHYWFYAGYEILTNGIKLLMQTSQQIVIEAAMIIEDPVLSPSTSFNSISKYKTNSKYQFGIVYYDDFNRSSYVQTNTGLIKSTNSWGTTEGKSPKFDWTINHTAPLWATKYQLVRTEQLTHKTFLFWVASAVTVNSANSNLYDLNISSFNAYNTANKNSILAYDFSEGDRCTVHKDNSGWISGYDVSIVAYNETTGILTIDKKNTLTAGSGGILIEIYTPKTRSNQPQEQFYYEFGEVYSCAGGVHSVTTGSLKEGDIYVKSRVIVGSSTSTTLEDPNFSDFYKSNYSSNGRTNIFAPQAKQLTLPTDIRFSDTYVPNTNINGLNRFYGDAFETYDRVNGSIQKLAVRDNYLVTLQELKTGYIPINQSIIEDQGSGTSANVAISNKLLNKIRYFAGDYGIGLNPESFARFAGTMYFADPNRAVVLKLTSGLQPISTIGMDSYFTRTLSNVRNTANVKLIGGYDPRNDEYIITINKNDASSETLAFNEAINRWTSFYSFCPEHANYIFNKYMTFLDGSMYEHNTNTTFNVFYGASYPSKLDITFNQNPLLIKTFIGIMEQSNYLWTALEIITNTPNQLSSLNGNDFLQKEGIWFASILRDANSTGGLFEGDDLKGNWIKFKLQNTANAKLNTLSISNRQIPSYQGIK